MIRREGPGVNLSVVGAGVFWSCVTPVHSITLAVLRRAGTLWSWAEEFMPAAYLRSRRPIPYVNTNETDGRYRDCDRYSHSKFDAAG
jgi:hypothetical protein